LKSSSILEDSPTIDEYTNDSKPLKEKQSGFLITDDDDDEENIDEQPAGWEFC